MSCHRPRVRAWRRFARRLDISIIHLHQTRQTLFLTAPEHHLIQFVLHPPSCVVGNGRLAMQLHRRDAFLDLRQQVNRLKPDRQRQFAGFEDGAGDDRSLAMTPIAQALFAGIEVTAFVMVAAGTDEAIWPAQSEQGFEAFVFVAITFQKYLLTSQPVFTNTLRKFSRLQARPKRHERCVGAQFRPLF